MERECPRISWEKWRWADESREQPDTTYYCYLYHTLEQFNVGGGGGGGDSGYK
jgi:hypothetical protein